MSRTRNSLAILALPLSAQAHEVFHTKCSIPPASVSYVSSSDTRGTLDILWSCLFTIIACTWTVQHLNIPQQRDGRDPGWRGNIRWTLKRTWTSTKWMVATIVAPEILLAKNWADLNDARHSLQDFQTLAVQDGVPWTLTHSLFANMGGFVIRFHVARSILESHSSVVRPNPGVLQQRNAPKDGAFEVELEAQSLSTTAQRISVGQRRYDNTIESQPVSFSQPSVQQFETVYHLIGPEILSLRNAGLLSRLPHINLAEINDKSKSDYFARIITMSQIAWTVIQIIVRAAKHLAITQLEIAVIAFAACATILYGLNWYKPKGVEIPFTILQYREEIPKEVDRKLLKSTSSPSHVTFLSKLISVVPLLDLSESRDFGAQIPNDFNYGKVGRGNGDLYGLIIGSVVFGAFHLAAWNFKFPTRSEQVVWRVASAFCTGSCLLYFLAIALWFPLFCCIACIGALWECLATLICCDHYRFYDLDWDVACEHLFAASYMFLTISYVLARLFLLVEIFRSLCFLPPKAFISTWASDIPHVI